MEAAELFTLKGKNALVTGSAQGLGREIALALAKNGASLVLSDIQFPEAAAAAVRAAGARCTAVRADITDEDQMQAMAESAALPGNSFDTGAAGLSKGLFGPGKTDPHAEIWKAV
jgi:NAD(P)-dependent dehydrogenase (short-subunit alcohol dehydrogenase family)